LRRSSVYSSSFAENNRELRWRKQRNKNRDSLNRSRFKTIVLRNVESKTFLGLRPRLKSASDSRTLKTKSFANGRYRKRSINSSIERQ
jgi:hypothetical protein